MLRELARRFEVHAVVGQSLPEPGGENVAWLQLKDVRFYSTLDFPPPTGLVERLPARYAKALRFRLVRRSLRGPATGFLLDSHQLIVKLARENVFDAAIFVHLDAMALAPLVRRVSPKTKRVVDLDNVTHQLMLQQAQQGPVTSRFLSEMRNVRRLECSLFPDVDAFFACSDDDRDTLNKLNDPRIRGYTVPNGVDTGTNSSVSDAQKRQREVVLFCGSLNYEPNASGLAWFYRDIWPTVRRARPRARLRIIGRYDRPDRRLEALRQDTSIDLIGTVDQVSDHYAAASISIAPLRMGSGTRFKILESMAYGTPAVSTTLGAKGIRYQADGDIIIADTWQDFANAIQRLLSDPAIYSRISLAGRRLVESEYDWEIVGTRMAQAIHEITASTSAFRIAADG